MIVRGYSALWGHVIHEDKAPTVFMPGAFSASIEEHRAAGTMPAMLLNHYAETVLGVWTSLTEDDEGLLVEGRLNDTPPARLLVESGKMPTGLCFGPYELLQGRDFIERGNLAVVIGGVRLAEISIVEDPSNPWARASYGVHCLEASSIEVPSA